MNQYLFLLFSRSPRRIRVVENILQNHRTQATLFWAFNYGILDWLGAERKLSRADFEQWLSDKRDHGLISLTEQTACLTPAGLHRQKGVLDNFYQPHFSQWTWLTNPSDYADRFSLGIQALSELIHGEKQYTPLNLSLTGMGKVRDWLLTGNLQEPVSQTLMTIGSALEKVDPRLATMFANELFGYHLTGWTIEQAAAQLHVQVEEAAMMDRDVWLGVAHLVQQQGGPLWNLMADLTAPMPVAKSTWQTVQEFRAGKSIEQIARLRHLKASTIREHLLEAAIIIPDALDWERLMPKEKLDRLSQQYSGPALKWQFQAPTDGDSGAAFFDFRLLQILRRWQGDEK
ncbi:helix-turn-helix domain-containing protein [Limosilactobacillus secaliphilus]|uniref:helix-turn-helix domain-containing protein n=1 Tax=Limosilactobacillus secaliphilus TaxID=396268 RepID=UPI00070B9807|nr:helix-turn-helix domain-containing protein [Limosilactobacillus secaliphilus]